MGWYVSIDLKSFYASVECVARGMNPLKTHLVVADARRTNKTICLAVSPALKALGIGGRPRLFEVQQQVAAINAWRQTRVRGSLCGATADDEALRAQPELALAPIIAVPRMALYRAMSARIYSLYLQLVAPEDIYSYSVDEVFVDLTPYLGPRGVTPEAMARELVAAVWQETGITATAGIGTNLYLAKVAMDIMAKRMPPDEKGTRMAVLDELTYRKTLWRHRPLTDFWRIGRGTAKRLEDLGLYTMGDVARCSIGKADSYHNEALLYKNFGVNAELLIDHAWGWEPCTLADIKAYRPDNNSLSMGQVLQEPYTAEKTRRVVLEMAEAMALELLQKGMVCDEVVLTVGYDAVNLRREDGMAYRGAMQMDHYGRAVPKHAHGTEHLVHYSSSAHGLMQAAAALYDRIIDRKLLVRRLTLCANHVVSENDARVQPRQQSLFVSQGAQAQAQEETRERQMQEAVLALKTRFGKNAVLRGISLEEGATAMARNKQIGGHRA